MQPVGSLRTDLSEAHEMASYPTILSTYSSMLHDTLLESPSFICSLVYRVQASQCTAGQFGGINRMRAFIAEAESQICRFPDQYTLNRHTIRI